MLEVRDVPGKGRGVFATRDIKGGEVAFREQPLLLYPQQGTAAAFCSYCLRAFNSLGDIAETVVPCSSCGRVGFCGPACAAAATADPGSHCATVCGLLAACNMAGLTDEQQTALQFLARCCSLRLAVSAGDASAAARFSAITSLSSPLPLPQQPQEQKQDSMAPADSTTSDVVIQELHGRLNHAMAAIGTGLAAVLSLSEVVELLRKEGANGYGIMAPSVANGERRIRGTAIYAQASLINHECLPCLARFDYFDGCPSAAASSAPEVASSAVAPPGVNTAVEFRALHDVPAGEELTQSYFPLPWSLGDRQQRCQEDYGFRCTCPRCQEEATWSEEESEWETDEDAGIADPTPAKGSGHCDGSSYHATHQHQNHQQGGTADAAAVSDDRATEGVDSAYISIFLLKYVCPAEGCYGTLAPLPPPGRGDVFECNMCRRRRTEAEFLAELEAAQ